MQVFRFPIASGVLRIHNSTRIIIISCCDIACNTCHQLSSEPAAKNANRRAALKKCFSFLFCVVHRTIFVMRMTLHHCSAMRSSSSCDQKIAFFQSKTTILSSSLTPNLFALVNNSAAMCQTLSKTPANVNTIHLLHTSCYSTWVPLQVSYFQIALAF